MFLSGSSPDRIPIQDVRVAEKGDTRGRRKKPGAHQRQGTSVHRTGLIVAMRDMERGMRESPSGHSRRGPRVMQAITEAPLALTPDRCWTSDLSGLKLANAGPVGLR